MTTFHKLSIKEVKRETADAVSVSFEVPTRLKKDYEFLPGQYLTLKLHVNGEEIRRAYSLCNSPYDGSDLRVAVKKVKDGKGSNFINDHLKAGDSLEVMTPMGNFTSPLDPTHKKNYFLFAGGSGITPMMAILKAVLEKEPESKISLYYGNFSPEATIFKSDLDGLAGEFNNRLSVTYVFEKAPAGYPENLTGNLNPKLIENILKGTIVNSPENEFFICGPVPMMDNVKGVLEKMKVNPKQVHIEYFTSGSAEDKKEISTPAENVNAKVTVIMYGLETTFNLNTKGPSILDKALEEGVDVPYACKGAVCCTCRAKVVEGKVSMRQNFALTDEEVAQGFILTCQSHPITPEVKVDYDS